MPGSATRNESTSPKQEGQQANQTRQTSAVGTEGRADRERGLQRSQEGTAQTGVVRSDRGTTSLGGTANLNSPFALMRRMMEDMDRVFEDFGLSRAFGGGLGSSVSSPLWGGSGLWSGATGGGEDVLWAPPIEVFEKGNNLVVRAELPGLSPENVNVEVTGDALTIQGERRQESEDKGEGFYRSERSYGRFFRSIPLPEGTDPDKAQAKFKDGVLEVTLPTPKREERKGRKIQIR
jgi:HSP20 family protein